MIGLAHSGVADDGSGPDSCDAELLQVVEVRFDTFEIAAMPTTRLRAAAVIATYGVVGGTAVGEAVGHDEIENVTRRKPLVEASSGLAGRKRIPGLSRADGVRSSDDELLSACALGAQPEERPMSVVGSLCLCDDHTLACDMEAGVIKMFPVHEQHR